MPSGPRARDVSDERYPRATGALSRRTYAGLPSYSQSAPHRDSEGRAVRSVRLRYRAPSSLPSSRQSHGTGRVQGHVDSAQRGRRSGAALGAIRFSRARTANRKKMAQDDRADRSASDVKYRVSSYRTLAQSCLTSGRTHDDRYDHRQPRTRMAVAIWAGASWSPGGN